MSLYAVQKLIYQVNRDPALAQRLKAGPSAVLADYELSTEEHGALATPDIGLLYVLGVNGQLLMHYAALWGLAWDDYLQAMRQGVREHGPVRAGLYAMTTDGDPS